MHEYNILVYNNFTLVIIVSHFITIQNLKKNVPFLFKLSISIILKTTITCTLFP